MSGSSDSYRMSGVSLERLVMDQLEQAYGAQAPGVRALLLRHLAATFQGQTASLLDQTDLADVDHGLRASNAIIGDDSELLPFVVRDGLLYTQRDSHYEETIARWILERCPSSAIAGAVQIEQVLDGLFDPSHPATPGQRTAAETILAQPLTLLQGGPGTGKTYTAATAIRALGRLWRNPIRAPRLRLAAPTGKAAARLEQAVRSALLELPLPTPRAQTLHQLLEYRPADGSVQRDADRPIDADYVIVDEASMVAQPLFYQLVQALAPHTRLILMGDSDQLGPVDGGHVFRDLIEAARMPASPLGPSLAQLDVSVRFSANSGVGQLCDAIRQSNAEDAIALLQNPLISDLAYESESSAFLTTIESWAREWAIHHRSTPERCLRALDQSVVLTAVRHGSTGMLSLNGQFLRQLEENIGFVPIMMTYNDYRNNVFNGERGLRGADSHVVFDDPTNKSTRNFGPDRLRGLEESWAMTIHRSQGSEFDTVRLVLPSRSHRIVTRQSLYTAASRARKRLEVFGSEQVIREGIEQEERRTSGLVQRILAGALSNG